MLWKPSLRLAIKACIIYVGALAFYVLNDIVQGCGGWTPILKEILDVKVLHGYVRFTYMTAHHKTVPLWAVWGAAGAFFLVLARLLRKRRRLGKLFLWGGLAAVWMALNAGLGRVRIDIIRNHDQLVDFGIFILCAASAHWISRLTAPTKLPTQGDVVKEIFLGKPGILDNFDPQTGIGSFQPFFPILGRPRWKCVLPQDQVDRLRPGDFVWAIDIAGDAVVVEEVGYSLSGKV